MSCVEGRIPVANSAHSRHFWYRYPDFGITSSPSKDDEMGNFVHMPAQPLIPIERKSELSQV